jgi:hypothetical protein
VGLNQRAGRGESGGCGGVGCDIIRGWMRCAMWGFTRGNGWKWARGAGELCHAYPGVGCWMGRRRWGCGARFESRVAVGNVMRVLTLF